MPNHVTTKIEFSGEKENVNKILDLLSGDNTMNGERRCVDFNKIIPMPEDIYQGNLGQRERELYGKRNWYDWSNDNWGTKWNAYDCDTNEVDMVIFDTAWSCPLPVLNKLAEICYQHDVEFTGKWADEDMGCNTGIFECNNDEDEYYFGCEYMPNCSNEAYEIYVELKGECDCLGKDEDGDWIHYDCDNCPNKCH